MAMVFGMFMALLDIQIVSASLSDIQAGLSASSDQISWVQTSYLIAEVVMIPLSGFLGRLMSTRYLFVASCVGFTIASFLCGMSTSIEEMIVFRAIQGFVGGAMIPSVFAAAFTAFPRSMQPVLQPIIGLIATLAPTIGPTIGGYLTELMSWHWLFFINIVPGILVTLVSWALIDFDKPDWKLFDHFDWWGLGLMALFLCSLEYVLEEGANDDWFQSEEIRIFALLTAVGAVGFFWRAFTRPEPIVDLSAFGNRNFATGSLFSFCMGIGLYGLTYLYPLYLAHVRGYTALMIGETMMVSGVAMFLSAPLVGRISAVLDLRIMMGIGFAGFALGTWMLTGMTRDWDYWELFVPQVLRGVSLMMCMVPITNIALGTLPPERLKNASGLFNLMRNLGGAVGLAVINTLINNRHDLHMARLRDHATASNPRALEWLSQVATRFADQGVLADTMALKKLAQTVRAEAYVMALSDVFFLLTVLFLALVPMILILRKPRMAGGGGGGH
ncbi:DHA2 family efflux MFS transporter permease subunit [Segnochrobactraceae bacterium EtOH-i3]